MNILLKKVCRVLVKAIACLNSELPRILENDLADMQGKGTGAESIIDEVSTALGFLPHKKRGVYDFDSKSNLVVFDVGANIGSYTKEVLRQKPGVQIFAFEPSSSSRYKFTENLKLEASVKLEAFGLSEGVSKATLYADYYGSPISSLSRRNLRHFGIEFNLKAEVTLNSIDNYCAITGIIPDLLKIDVEGYELSVLKGCLSVLDKISVVQFEFGGCNIDTRTFFQDFWYLFNKYDFRIYRITSKKPILLNQYSEADEFFSTTNYLAVNNRFSDLTTHL